MSTIGSVASSALHATMMKPPPGPAQAPSGGIQRKPDGDGDIDGGSSVSTKSASTKLLDLSV